MAEIESTFLPAAGKDWFLPFYDIFTKLLGFDGSHRRLLEHASIQPGYRVLEIGCGTGNLALLAKQVTPDAVILGIDPDMKALARAQQKAFTPDQDIQVQQAYSEHLPFSDASFDRVLSAFMLHHVLPDAKAATLREVYRTLRPGGSLYLVDFQEEEHSGGSHFTVGHLLHQETRMRQMITQHLLDTGFVDVTKIDQQDTFIGRIAYFSAVRPTV